MFLSSLPWGTCDTYLFFIQNGRSVDYQGHCTVALVIEDLPKRLFLHRNCAYRKGRGPRRSRQRCARLYLCSFVWLFACLLIHQSVRLFTPFFPSLLARLLACFSCCDFPFDRERSPFPPRGAAHIAASCQRYAIGSLKLMVFIKSDLPRGRDLGVPR